MNNKIDICQARIQKIVVALNRAESGHEVFFALCSIPTKNLEDMNSMIDHILNERKIKEEW